MLGRHKAKGDIGAPLLRRGSTEFVSISVRRILHILVAGICYNSDELLGNGSFNSPSTFRPERRGSG